MLFIIVFHPSSSRHYGKRERHDPLRKKGGNGPEKEAWKDCFTCNKRKRKKGVCISGIKLSGAINLAGPCLYHRWLAAMEISFNCIFGYRCCCFSSPFFFRNKWCACLKLSPMNWTIRGRETFSCRDDSIAFISFPLFLFCRQMRDSLKRRRRATNFARGKKEGNFCLRKSLRDIALSPSSNIVLWIIVRIFLARLIKSPA